MSSDPKRWLDAGGGATESERALLQSAGDGEPPTDAQAAVWALVATRLPPPVGGGSGRPPPAPPIGASGAGALAKTGALSTLAKGAIAVALGGAVVGGGFFATRPVSSPLPPVEVGAPLAQPSIVQPVQPAPSTAAPSTAAPSAFGGSATVVEDISRVPREFPSEETARVVAPAAPSASAAPVRPRPRATPAGGGTRPPPSAEAPVAMPERVPPASGPANVADALREERALLASARDALRRHDGRAALATLRMAETRFPDGILAQEREVLAIEALAQSGDRDAASRRAHGFLKAYPSSPHASHVREFVR